MEVVVQLPQQQRDWEQIPALVEGPPRAELQLPEVQLQPCTTVLNANLVPWIVCSQASGRGYRITRTLQNCIYGKVFQAVETADHITGTPVQPLVHYAVKTMDLQGIARRIGQYREDPYKEINAMEWLREPGSPNMLQLVECLSDGRTMYVITPYCAGGDLFDLVLRGPMSEDVARPLFRQIVESIDYCHHKAICHHDISIENTMLNEDQTQCLLMDFGMSLHMPYTATERYMSERDHRQGKQSCLAIECADGLDYDGCKVDVFAAGSVLYMMLIGNRPWDSPHRTDDWFRVIVIEGRLEYVMQHMHANVSEAAIELIKWMYRVDSRQRPSARQVLQHRWFGGPLSAPPLELPPPPPPQGKKPSSAGGRRRYRPAGARA